MREPSIYRSTDFRKFLADYFIARKKDKPYFSHRYFCKLAGFKTPSVIKLVIDGKRNLSRTSILKVSKAIGFCNSEHQFFEALVLYNQATDAEQKRTWFFKLEELRGVTAPALIETRQHSFYKEWYNPVIRECLGIPGLQQSPEALANRIRPRISPDKIRDAIRLMESLGLIARDKKGCYNLMHQTITTASELDSEYVAHFNREMIRLAQQASISIPNQKREISGLTLRISRKCLKEIKTRIMNFKKELLILASNDTDSDTVYQFNVQLFPLLDDE